MYSSRSAQQVRRSDFKLFRNCEEQGSEQLRYFCSNDIQEGVTHMLKNLCGFSHKLGSYARAE